MANPDIELPLHRGVLQSIRYPSEPEQEIRKGTPGDVFTLRDAWDKWWDGCYASGDRFVLRVGEKFFYPDLSILYEGPFMRVIPHPDGPIIEITPWVHFQNGKVFSPQVNIGELSRTGMNNQPINTIGHVARRNRNTELLVCDSRGTVCANLTELVGISDYDHIERHQCGLMLSVGNTVYLAITI